MVNLNQSQSIKLGLVLEACMASILSGAGYAFDNSEAYSNLLTRPDFIILQDDRPIASIAVTATSSGETWIKKRWRYIDEIGQLKSFFGPDFLVINVFYGDISVMEESESDVVDAFFDASISASETDCGKAVFDSAIDLILRYPTQPYRKIAGTMIETSAWDAHRLSLLPVLERIIENRAELVRGNLFRGVWEKEHPSYRERLRTVQQKEYSQSETYLRYAAINGLLIGRSDMDVLIRSAAAGTAVPRETIERCKKTEFQFTPRIGGTYITDRRFSATVNSGFSSEVYAAIEGTVISSETQRYLLKDIQDETRINAMVEKSWDYFDSPGHIAWIMASAFKDECFMGIPHVRVWPLDVACAIIGESISSLSRDYTAEYGHIRGLSSVKGFITKTTLLKRQFSNAETLNSFCGNLAALLHGKMQSIAYPSKREVKEYLARKKRDDLNLQPYINPLQRYAESIFEKNGFQVSKTPIPCMLSSIAGIPAQMKKIHEVYQITKNGQTLWVKCIGGYDGVKDKTREMAARGRLLQYSSAASRKRGIRMVFVYDGYWPPDLQKLLCLSGWEDIVPVFELDRFLSSEKT